MLSNFVAVEMTSHQNSPFPFESMPAWISIALAFPISAGILLSTTEFCWGCSWHCEFKNHTQILFVTFLLEALVLSSIVKPDLLYFNCVFL